MPILTDVSLLHHMAHAFLLDINQEHVPMKREDVLRSGLIPRSTLFFFHVSTHPISFHVLTLMKEKREIKCGIVNGHNPFLFIRHVRSLFLFYNMSGHGWKRNRMTVNLMDGWLWPAGPSRERESAIIRWLQSTIANAFSYTLDGRAKKSVHEPRVDHSVSISVWPLSWGSVLRTLMATLIMLTPSTLGKETITSWSQETASAHPKRLWKKNSCRGLCLSSSRVNVSFFLLSLSASSAITSWSSSRERKGILLNQRFLSPRSSSFTFSLMDRGRNLFIQE